MLLNDQLGDCVIAAMGHMVQQWTYFSTAGAGMQTMTDAEALAAYEAIAGYNPSDPATDQGTDMLTALNYWRNTGIMVAGNSTRLPVMSGRSDESSGSAEAILAFRQPVYGRATPCQRSEPSDWIVPDGGVYGPAGKPGSWGGHCIPTMAESPETLSCITWAERLKMSHNFLFDYCDECYAVLSPDWFTTAPNGFDSKQLQADLAAL